MIHKNVDSIFKYLLLQSTTKACLKGAFPPPFFLLFLWDKPVVFPRVENTSEPTCVKITHVRCLSLCYWWQKQEECLFICFLFFTRNRRWTAYRVVSNQIWMVNLPWEQIDIGLLSHKVYLEAYSLILYEANSGTVIALFGERAQWRSIFIPQGAINANVPSSCTVKMWCDESDIWLWMVLVWIVSERGSQHQKNPQKSLQ